MTREEHIAWCKQRALEYADAGDPLKAFASMASDLTKHPDTRSVLSLERVAQGQAAVGKGTDAIREWIDAFA